MILRDGHILRVEGNHCEDEEEGTDGSENRHRPFRDGDDWMRGEFIVLMVFILPFENMGDKEEGD